MIAKSIEISQPEVVLFNSKGTGIDVEVRPSAGGTRDRKLHLARSLLPTFRAHRVCMTASTSVILAISLGLVLFVPGFQAHAQPAHDGGPLVAGEASVLASWPAGTFLESIAVGLDGTVHIINHGAKTIERVRNGIIELFAELPMEGTGLLPYQAGGFLVTARRDDGSEAILSVAPNGVTATLTEVPGAGFLNGMTWLSLGDVLAADSSAGTIWRIDTRTGVVDGFVAQML